MNKQMNESRSGPKLTRSFFYLELMQEGSHPGLFHSVIGATTGLMVRTCRRKVRALMSS